MPCVRHKPPLYNGWIQMRRNCRISKYLVGISVCPEWSSFRTYEKWCLDNGWKPGLMVARVDKDKDYSPDNCRVVTMTEFNGMRRCVRRLEDGRTVREATGIAWEKDKLFASRVRRRVLVGGWDIESALEVPKLSPRESACNGHCQRGNEKMRRAS